MGIGGERMKYWLEWIDFHHIYIKDEEKDTWEPEKSFGRRSLRIVQVLKTDEVGAKPMNIRCLCLLGTNHV